MNIISLTPTLVVHYLQTLNVKFNTERTLDKKNIKDDVVQENPIENKRDTDSNNEDINAEIAQLTSNMEKV